MPKHRGRGRPKAKHPLGVRIMVRFNAKAQKAIGEFVTRKAIKSESTAVRIIVLDRLRQEGML